MQSWRPVTNLLLTPKQLLRNIWLLHVRASPILPPRLSLPPRARSLMIETGMEREIKRGDEQSGGE